MKTGSFYSFIFITLFVIVFVPGCVKEPNTIATPDFNDSPRVSLEVKERDSIIGHYSGIRSYTTQYVAGGDIDTSYSFSYEVVKHGLDSIRIIPPLPLNHSAIASEFFVYNDSNYYDQHYSTTYSVYNIILKFNPDSSKMEFTCGFWEGIEGSSRSNKFTGEKD